jgi:hypothetical protein
MVGEPIPLSPAQTSKTTLLVDIDHRPASPLSGDWPVIVSPYDLINPVLLKGTAEAFGILERAVRLNR